MQQHSKTTAKEVQNIVLMEAVSSAEHIIREGDTPRRVLSDVHLRINRREVWGITARTGYEVLLLLEIMGNLRPYDGGKCVLVERGMMRRKRIIQQHVFYIGEPDMLAYNMNVLEYLMFATTYIREDRLLMQEELFEFLINIGLGDICLSATRWLTAEEKSVVALVAAAHSDCMMIVFNLPESTFDERLSGAIAKTAELITQRGKTLIIGTKDCALIEKACSHTAYIADGRIIYQGTTDNLRQEFDKVVVIINDADIGNIKQKLVHVLTGYALIEKEGSLLIKAVGDESSPLRIYQKIVEASIVPRCMRVNEKTVGNAYEELMLLHDLPEQLF